MNVFAVLAPQPNPKLDSQVETLFAGNCLRLATNQWLVAAAGTAREISDKLEITVSSAEKVINGPTGIAVVITVSGYFGVAPTNVWEWLKAKTEAVSP